MQVVERGNLSVRAAFKRRKKTRILPSQIASLGSCFWPNLEGAYLSHFLIRSYADFRTLISAVQYILD